MPLSAVVTDRAVMDVITPGTHGTPFGGNPLAAAIGRAVVKLLDTHGSTIRLSPPLTITPDELDWLTGWLVRSLKSLAA
ncbi:aminotransferase class III-fold pyridoxal phosphate-dependent enzyme [Kribbella sp. NPDC056951]|uniref:aminotransferase class III-fold pyridoxal phosphate-dependent enzyme n=1 Tax=Kribbella sp. NPDC056951 TaxID=3345978 RepID=UPI003634D249